jgi:hypothetical protein
MKLTREQRRVLRALLRHKSEDFAELVALTGLDPATDFEDADLGGVDFGTADIGAFNFAKANLEGADLSHARGRDRPMLPPALRRMSAQEFWGEAVGPTWADDWGIDAHGRWVRFSVPAADGTRVPQRMRWIPPGRFTIGSSGDEPGRYENERPQQEIAIANGFWLFDTPCTQALWQAVMGDNPSRAACCNHDEPANRNDNLGFRCARAHEQAGWSAPEQAGLPGGMGRQNERRPACW